MTLNSNFFVLFHFQVTQNQVTFTNRVIWIIWTCRKTISKPCTTIAARNCTRRIRTDIRNNTDNPIIVATIRLASGWTASIKIVGQPKRNTWVVSIPSPIHIKTEKKKNEYAGLFFFCCCSFRTMKHFDGRWEVVEGRVTPQSGQLGQANKTENTSGQ